MKPYDVPALMAKLKERGLNVAEDAAKSVVGDFFDWLEESIKLSPTPFDDMALGGVKAFRAMALTEVDKIDGNEG